MSEHRERTPAEKVSRRLKTLKRRRDWLGKDLYQNDHKCAEFAALRWAIEVIESIPKGDLERTTAELTNAHRIEAAQKGLTP